MELDHETRANRYLDSMRAIEDMLCFATPDLQVNAGNLGQLLSVLRDEAQKVVKPFSHMGANDDDNDP